MTKITNKAFVEAIKNGVEVENAIAAFAEQNGVEVEAVEKIAHAVKTLKNTAVRIYKKGGNRFYNMVVVNYDGRGWRGSFRGSVEFRFNDNGHCFGVYGGAECDL